jgi:DNA-binding transcriptional ArsR family regulator
VTNTSRHLQLLRRALLVEGRRERKRVFYRYRAKTRLSGCCTHPQSGRRAEHRRTWRRFLPPGFAATLWML